MSKPPPIQQHAASNRPTNIEATVGKAWVPPSAPDDRGSPSSGIGAHGFQSLSSLLDDPGAVVGKTLRTAWRAVEFLLGLILVFVAPFVFLFLLVTQAKWALALGALTTAALALWRTRMDGWSERSAEKPISVKGRAKLTLLILSLNCMFWGLLIASVIPLSWVAEFNALAPAWLADSNWEKWSEPFRHTLEAVVAMLLIDAFAYLLALLPFVFVFVSIVGLVLVIGLPRVEDKLMYIARVLALALAASVVIHIFWGRSLDWLFWAINGYILWKGAEWLALLSVIVIGFMPFRIVEVLRRGRWLRGFFE